MLYFSIMTFNMCFNCVLILVFFRFPKKLTMAQLRHLEIGIDATEYRANKVEMRNRSISKCAGRQYLST